jgi:hypothetical protein
MRKIYIINQSDKLGIINGGTIRITSLQCNNYQHKISSSSSFTNINIKESTTIVNNL